MEYKEHGFELRFADINSELPQPSGLCAGADGAGHDHDDVSSNNCSSSGGSGSADNDDKSGPSNDETGSVGNDDEEESVKKFVKESVLISR